MGYGVTIFFKDRFVVPKYGHAVELGEMSALIGVITFVVGISFTYMAIKSKH